MSTNLFGKDYFSNEDFSNLIEKKLSNLRAAASQSDDLLMKVEDIAYNLISSSRKNGTLDKISSLTDDLELNARNVNQTVDDTMTKVTVSNNFPNSSGVLSEVYAKQLQEFKNLKSSDTKIEDITSILNIENKTQKYSTQVAGYIKQYQTDIIDGFNVEKTMIELDEVLNFQTLFNESKMSKDLLENLDFWQEELTDLQSRFKLDDLGKLNPTKLFDDVMKTTLSSVSGGQLLNKILPDNFEKEFRKYFKWN